MAPHLVGDGGQSDGHGQPEKQHEASAAFMIIDVKKKEVRATGDSDGDASSPIKAKEITEQSVILQGFENHRGWTMAIDRSDGSLNLSSTGPEVNFMITGNCTAI